MRTSSGETGSTQPGMLQGAPKRSFSLEQVSPEGLGSETGVYGRSVSQPKVAQAGRGCVVTLCPEDIQVLTMLQTSLGSHTPCQQPDVSVSLVLPPSSLHGQYSQYCWRMGVAMGQVNQQGTLFVPHPAYARIILRAEESFAWA